MDPISMIVLMAFMSLLGKGVDYIANKNQRNEQVQHDINMANLQAKNELEVQKTMFDTQNSFNTWQNNRSQMVEAGFSPALMYGGSSSPVSFGASGSASGSASSLPALSPAFKSLDPFEFGSYQIGKQNADTASRGTEADVDLKNQQKLESASRTAENLRNTAFKKHMENVIYDQAMANLDLTASQTEDFKSRVKERDTLLPYRTAELDANARRIVTEIEREPWIRSQISADIKRLRSLGNLYDEESVSEGKRRAYYGAEIAEVNESLKQGQLSRIMRTFGLEQRHLGHVSDYRNLTFTDSEKMAYDTLIESGFSPSEATGAVLWYTGVDPKDLTPSLINGASRVLSGFVPKTSIRK